MSRKIIKQTLDVVEGTVNEVEREVNSLMAPVRQSVFSRFPILFLLLVTFGVICVMSGFERLIEQMSYFDKHPFVLLTVGIFVLIGTGTLYKKLG